MRKRRRIKSELIAILDSVHLYLKAGFDLAYSWPEAVRALSADISGELRELISIQQSENLGQTLHRLGKEFPIANSRLWFQVIEELYTSGVPLAEPIEAMANELRRDQQRDFERHQKTLPTKINALILVFFLPPTLVLLFAPLMLEMLRVLPD